MEDDAAKDEAEAKAEKKAKQKAAFREVKLAICFRLFKSTHTL